MTTITFDIDETIATQDIYCKELDKFLHIDIITDVELQNKIQAAKAQAAQHQNIASILEPLLALQQAIKAAPVVTPGI